MHAVGTYPSRLRDVVPARPTAGNAAGRTALQAAAVALASAGDEISRATLLSGHRDLGLRGGQVRFSGGRLLRIELRNYRWVRNATVSGTAVWDRRTGAVTARLTVRSPGIAAVRLTARWRAFARPGQLAVITGSQGGKRLAAVLSAP